MRLTHIMLGLCVAGALGGSLQAQDAVSKKSGYALSNETCGSAPFAFPKLRITMQPGYCAGLVASNEDGLVFPRNLTQVPGTRFFVVADMGGWGAGAGRLLLLDPQAAAGKRLKVLLGKLDLPHGLAVGPDRRIYVGVVDRIFRFDPLAAEPAATVETVVQGLPGLRPVLSDGSRLDGNSHPLKHIVFDRTGRLFVNIGAPSDACAKSAAETKPCSAGEGAAPLAAVWMFTPPVGGIFVALKPGDPNPKREVFARGLRNSMALAPHPRFPDPGFAFLQGENARDLPDEGKPNEELNALEPGKHYGWPYCYDLSTVSPEYAVFLRTSTAYRNLCGNAARYRPPHSLMPPHGAPLSMLYYQGDKFPELRGRLIVGLHGYRPTGARLLVYEVDANGFPKVAPPPVRYGVSCAAEPTQPFRTDAQPQVAAAPFTELIGGWHKVNGVRPQGAPVGITVASDGAIWLAEDRNQTIIRIDAEPASATVGPLPCDARTVAQIDELAAMVARSTDNTKRLDQVRAQLVEKHCVGCHSDFDIKPGMSGAQKDTAVLRFMLAQDGWVYPGDPGAGRLHARVFGQGAGKVMPADGLALIANDPAYRQLLAALDQLVATMVPGTRRRVDVGRAVALTLRNRAGKVCGELPNKSIVVVVDAKPKEKPGFARLYRPADQYLDAGCQDRDGYYAPAANLRAL